MSIQALELPGAPSPFETDSSETALIRGLFGDIFSGRNPAEASTSKLPFPQPTSPPATLAGFPGQLPVKPPADPAAATAPPSADVRDVGLNGGFPTTSSSPSVHPTVVGAEPEHASPGPAAPSGTHDERSSRRNESYQYGEPRFYAQSLGHRGTDAPVDTDLSSLHKAPSFPHLGNAVSADPSFYFITDPKNGGFQGPAPVLSQLNVDSVRRDFPALNQRVNGHPLIYLDNAATTHKPQVVLDATSQFYGRDNSNIHRAAHALAERSTKLFEAGREKVRQFLGASDAKEIVFLRGTTEAINLVANSYGRRHVGPGDEILLTQLEHHANIVPWQLLAAQTGAVIRVVPINDRGELILEEFAKLLSERTKIVSVTHVSNALGTVNPVEQIIPLAHAVGAVVLVDGAQSTPHLPVNVTALDADFFVFSGHKIFGPTGIGALYGKKRLLDEMPPWQGGGHMIQDVTFEKTLYRPAPEKFEAGTPDIAGVVGLGAAIDYLFRTGIPAIAAYEHALLEYATHLLAEVPGLRPIGTAANKASVLSFIIPGVPNDKIAQALDRQGIAVRAGHHCALPAQRHFGQDTTVRPSLAFYNTFAEVDALAAALHHIVRH